MSNKSWSNFYNVESWKGENVRIKKVSLTSKVNDSGENKLLQIFVLKAEHLF